MTMGEGTVWMVEAKTGVGARAASQGEVFQAHALLLAGSDPASVSKNSKWFDVVNMSIKRVCPGDRMPVAKTQQGHYITVAMLVGRAMFAKFAKNGESWDVVDYWQGEDPSICDEPTVVFDFDSSCLQDGAEVVASYDPENDQYRALATESAMLGPASDVTVVDGADPGIHWSTGNCGQLDYAVRTIKAFRCGEDEEADPDPNLIEKTAPWNGTIGTVLVGASITTNGAGNPCLTYTTAYSMICSVSQGTPDPIEICGHPCCDKVVYYNRYASPGEIPAEATHVGQYTEYYVTDEVAEQCFLPADAPAGWTQGFAEELGAGFTRNALSPECCPPEEGV